MNVTPPLHHPSTPHTRTQALSGLRKYESSFRHQVAVLSGRRATGLWRHPLLLGLHFAATGLMALGVGAIYWHTGRDTGGIQVRRGRLRVGVCVGVGGWGWEGGAGRGVWERGWQCV